MLEVRDHGPGIPEGELARIFRRFERAASIRNYGGLGLGLYFIQAIVDAHGGSVTADERDRRRRALSDHAAAAHHRRRPRTAICSRQT